MGIKTAEELIKPHSGECWEYDQKLKVVPYDYAVKLAIEYAKQFIDLAAEEAEIEDVDEEHVIGVRVSKQSILDIKQLIK